MTIRRKGQFDVQTFLDSAGFAKKIVDFHRGDVVYTQGDPCDTVMYLRGKSANLLSIGAVDFGIIVDSTVMESTILFVQKHVMVGLLHRQHALSDRFISHMLARNIRIEEDLVDQLFNSSEKRLARTLLLLARYGKHDRPVRDVPPISQETLAEMIGTTRSRVNFFMKKFERLGFITYKEGLKVNNSLLTVVLHD